MIYHVFRIYLCTISTILNRDSTEEVWRFDISQPSSCTTGSWACSTQVKIMSRDTVSHFSKRDACVDDIVAIVLSRLHRVHWMNGLKREIRMSHSRTQWRFGRGISRQATDLR